MHEFKAWQMEYGDADIDWDNMDHDMDHEKEDYDDKEPQVQPGNFGNNYVIGIKIWSLKNF